MKKIYFFLGLLFCSVYACGQVTILLQDFNGATNNWTTINNSTGGIPANAAWTLRPDGYVYNNSIFNPTTTFHSNDASQFYLSNSDAQGDDVPPPITNTILQSPSFSTVGYTGVSLQFYHFFRFSGDPDQVFVEVSTDGSAWTPVQSYIGNTGDSAAFAVANINLLAYAGMPLVYIRFRFYSEFGWYWAIDNVTVTVSGALPVTLLSFSGYRENNHNLLKWTTASEQNNRGFQVERSTDGINYTSIGFVNSLASSGNSNAAIDYTFNDNNIAGSKQYYRLRQTDIDGREKLSRIVLIKGSKPFVLTIGSLFPNPAKTEVNVLIDAPNHDETILQVIDINGRLVKQKSAVVETGSNTIPIDITGLVNGTYILKVVCKSNGEIKTGRFIKER